MSKNFRSLWSHYEMIGQVCSLCDVVVNVTFPEKVKNPINRLVMILRDHRGNIKSSSETQGQSVGSGEKAWGKFSTTRKRAPGYRLSPNFFQKFKRMPAPDWAQKKLCIIVPNRWTVSAEFFSWVRTRRLFVRFFQQACACKGNFYFLLSKPERKELPMSRKNVWDAISRNNSICPENILFLTDQNVSQIIGRLRCGGDEKVK